MLRPARVVPLAISRLYTGTDFGSTPPELGLEENVRLKRSAGFFPSLFACKGVSRPHFQEHQLHFPSSAAAQAWLTRYSKNRPDTVWTIDGLVVQWLVSPTRYQIDVDLTQICIQAKKPDRLAGASETAIEITRASSSGPLRHDCVQVGPAVERHTESLWDAHWKQADSMNEQVRKAAVPASGAPR